MRPRSRRLKIVLMLVIVMMAFMAVKVVYESSNFKPQPFFEIPFRERIQSKVQDAVKVSVAVLSAEESKQIFGVNLAEDDIQPVWIRVENQDSKPYYLMSSGLDPDYFSPLEAAYLNHSIFSKSRNKKIDEHFRVLGFRNPIASGASVSGSSTTGGSVGTAEGCGTGVAGAAVGCGAGVERRLGRDGADRCGASGRTSLTATTGSWTGREAARRPTR